VAISFANVHVLDPSRAARRLLWHVLSIGYVSRDEPENHAGMDKAGLFLFRVKSGSGTLEVPDARYDLKRGSSWWLIDLARPRRYVPRANGRLVTMGIRFSGPGVEAWRDAVLHGQAGCRVAGELQSARLRAAADELLEIAARTPGETEWETHELLTRVQGVLLQAQDVLNSRRPEAHLPTRRVVEAVQANPLRDWQAAELSALAGIGYSTLRSRFKASHGETLHEYLQRTRLEQARSRLTDRRLTVKEIALQLNFSSEFYFSRWFRQSAGMSPSRFRTLIRG
jgi:AraC-like DNA-binding protein